MQLGYRDLFAAIFPAGDGGDPVIERENSEEFSQIPVDIPQKNEHGEESVDALKEHHDCSEALLCLQNNGDSKYYTEAFFCAKEYQDPFTSRQKTGNWVEDWELAKCKVFGKLSQRTTIPHLFGKKDKR